MLTKFKVFTKCATLIAASLASSNGIAQVSPGGVRFFGDRIIRESVASTAPIVQTACSLSTVAALRADGTVLTWGDNNEGRAWVPSGLMRVTRLAAGNGHTLALKSDGTVAAWGVNSYGQCDVPAGLTNVVSIWAGEDMSFAIKKDGTLSYWGHVPTPPAGLSGLVQVGAGDGFVIALRSNGTLVGWGDSGANKLSFPSGTVGVVQIAVNRFRSLALKSDGSVIAWGSGSFGEELVPANLGPVKAIAAGSNHNVALKQDGTVTAWGAAGLGQCTIPAGATGIQSIAANGSFTALLGVDGTPLLFGDSGFGQTVVANFNHAAKISGAFGHLISVNHGGTVTYWGRNDFGQANIPSTAHDVTDAAVGLWHGIACRQDGKVVTWGSNSHGQNAAQSFSNITRVAAGRFHSMALSNTGSTLSWGNGMGAPSNLGPATQIVGGSLHAGVLHPNGTVTVWGDNFYGQKDVPNNLTNVIKLATNNDQLGAVKSDGTIVTWGWFSNGLNQVPTGLSGVRDLSIGTFHAVALLVDGTVKGWGQDVKKQVSPLVDLREVSQVVASGEATACLMRMHLRIAPYQVFGAVPATGTVYLASPAPTGGLTVGLVSNNSIATVPPTITVPEGQVSATFPVKVGNPTTSTQALVTASLEGLEQSCLLTVVPRPLSLVLSRSSVVGGSTAPLKATVRLHQAAPAGGAIVTLQTTSSAITVPTSVVIPAGAKSATVAVEHGRVSSSVAAGITATYGPDQSATELTVTPYKVTLSSPTGVLGGLTFSATVKLDAIPSEPVQVSLGTDRPDVIAPTSITIPGGAQQAVFQLASTAVPTITTVQLSGTFDGESVTRTIKVNAGVSSVKFSAGMLAGGGELDCTVSIGLPAPTGGWTVNLAGTNCQVPSSRTIPEGAKSVTFSVLANDISVNTAATVTASSGPASIVALKAILPNVPKAFVVSPSTVVGGSTTLVSGTVTLNGPAPVDTVIALSCSDPAVSAPPAVTILAGETSKSFSIGHSGVSAKRTVSIQATRLGVAKVAKLTLDKG